MRKTGMVGGLLVALVLAAPLAAGADGDDSRSFQRDDRWQDHGRWEQRYDARHVRHGERRDWNGGWWRHPRAQGWQRGWHPRWHPRWDHGPRGHWRRRDNGSFITGALIGSTLTRGALHERGDHRYCDRDRRRSSVPALCYRVERLPGGRERRVPLPDRACF